jgi:hypothetical protein
MTTLTRSLTVLSVVLLTAASASAATYNEIGNGDLSGNRNAPTMFNLTVGSNDLFATTAGGDLDVVTVNVPAGNLLKGLFLRSFTQAGFDGTAFVGLQAGSTFTVDPNVAGAASLLGYAHFGTSPGNVGANLLPEIDGAFGSMGFPPPHNITNDLPAGPYSLFLQQLGTANTYQLDFVVEPIPEPATILLAAGAFLAVLWRCRRVSRAH